MQPLKIAKITYNSVACYPKAVKSQYLGLRFWWNNGDSESFSDYMSYRWRLMEHKEKLNKEIDELKQSEQKTFKR
jgi:hypothetical protein